MRQGLLNPSAGFVRCSEQGRNANVAFAEPGFQVPPPPALGVVVLAIKADDHGRELAVCEDQVALAVMAVDEHAHRLE